MTEQLERERRAEKTEIDPILGSLFFVRKRDGRITEFDEYKIRLAIEKAFKAEHDLPTDKPLDEVTQETVQVIGRKVINQVLGAANKGEELDIETIQDAVENQLMHDGFYPIARRYIKYRDQRKKARALRGDIDTEGEPQAKLYVQYRDGRREVLDQERLYRTIEQASREIHPECKPGPILDEVIRSLYDGIAPDEIEQAMIMAARSRIEIEPAYSYVAARLLLKKIYKEVLQKNVHLESRETALREHFTRYVHQGVSLDRLSPELLDFDLDKLATVMCIERDHTFNYMGLQTLYDRYLIHIEERRIESPQYFWMRVSMGLAINEGAQKNERAMEFYHTLSTFRFISSTPTLFNAGTCHPQLSSCYLLTVMDDLEHIFKIISDDAKLSKWAGGLGNDWTNVRATGSHIKGTNGKSQGVIPFLKVANDTAVAVNQGGKRKGALCSYLETWHLDIEDFLELRKNTGDERRRTHDMHTANWIPDLFMKRVKEGGSWTLFSPCEANDLHDLYGMDFEKRYLEYEAMAERKEIRQHRKVDAVQLWRKMLNMVFETGHPWITFKDPSNIRSPQDHAGVVHSSNLCTEILLNTSKQESAVCNLGSINLSKHVREGDLDEEKLSSTIRTAIRMLDNVIDINFYPTEETQNSNLQHRPIGMGLMGFQDTLHIMNISYASDEAVSFADRSMEMISYYAILASTELARERDPYPSYPGSKWERGILPIDTLDLLEKERGGHLDVDRTCTMDWSQVREAVQQHGMRNSNTMAIAPTATIANITGVSQSIEPSYKNLYAKSNLSGEFTVVNPYLVNDLKELELWDEEMVDNLKYFDGSLQEIERIPLDLRQKYITAFELDPHWLIDCASRRQKWIDMGQSLNLYLAAPDGRKLSAMYMHAWERGLKTTYYLRSLSATQVEKSTVDINRYGIQPPWMKSRSASSNIQVEREAPKACSIDVPDCESCQ